MGKDSPRSLRRSKTLKNRNRVRRIESLEARALLDGNGFIEDGNSVVGFLTPPAPYQDFVHQVSITSVTNDGDNPNTPLLVEANDGIVHVAESLVVPGVRSGVRSQLSSMTSRGLYLVSRMVR